MQPSSSGIQVIVIYSCDHMTATGVFQHFCEKKWLGKVQGGVTRSPSPWHGLRLEAAVLTQMATSLQCVLPVCSLLQSKWLE